MSTDHDRWVVRLDPWIVQDGNYGEFSVGEVYEFALEFEPGRIARIDPAQAGATHLGGTRYRVEAPVVYARDRLWMIELGGVLAYCDVALPDGITAGAWIAGELDLGIDCFSYFERHGAVPGVPAAIHTWRITGIRELASPALPPGVFELPEKREWSAREVHETNAWWEHDDVAVSYELACEKLDRPPRRQRSGGG